MIVLGWASFIAFWIALLGSAFMGMPDSIAMVLAVPMILWYGLERYFDY